MNCSNMMNSDSTSSVGYKSAVTSERETVSVIEGMTGKYLTEAEYNLMRIIEYLDPATEGYGEDAIPANGLMGTMRDNRKRAERVDFLVRKVAEMLGEN